MSDYDSIPFESQNVIDTVFNLDDNSKNAIGRLWTLYMAANNNSMLIADQQLENFLNSLQQYIGQPQTILQVINQEIDEVNLRIVHDNEIFHGGFSLKRRKTGKKRKGVLWKQVGKQVEKKKRRKTIKGGKDITTYSLNQPSLYNGNTQQELAMRRQQLEMLRRQQQQQQQAIRRQVPIQADPNGLRQQQQDIGRFLMD